MQASKEEGEIDIVDIQDNQNQGKKKNQKRKIRSPSPIIVEVKKDNSIEIQEKLYLQEQNRKKKAIMAHKPHESNSNTKKN